MSHQKNLALLPIWLMLVNGTPYIHSNQKLTSHPKMPLLIAHTINKPKVLLMLLHKSICKLHLSPVLYLRPVVCLPKITERPATYRNVVPNLTPPTIRCILKYKFHLCHYLICAFNICKKQSIFSQTS